MSVDEGFVSVEPEAATEVGGGPLSAPARSRIATRRRIVEAGTELFACEGLHAVTSARIARAAGVASGTFYLHFEDKKHLFREIVFAAVARLQHAQGRAAAAAGPELHDQIRARISELATFAEQNRTLVTLVFGRDHEAASLDQDVLEALRPIVEEALRGRAESLQLSGTFPPAVATQALLGMQTRVIAWWSEDPSRATRDEIIETLCRMHPLWLPGQQGRRGEVT